ncbi:peroxiredoxin [Patescibacteria group bacterium]|nr:peroxiredoxin [Patescibacteria group bacterium]
MIHIGRPAPSFSHLKAYHKGEFHDLSLSDYKGKWVVLFFYPRDFTFICPTELKGFATHEKEFQAMNTEVVSASTDSEWSHKAWFERDLPMVQYPVIADTTHRLSRDYDVYNEQDGLAERGLFIIDPEQIVRYALVSSGSVGRSVKEVLRVVKALQSGDLCPMEWEPGQETLGKA